MCQIKMVAAQRHVAVANHLSWQQTGSIMTTTTVDRNLHHV